MIKPLDANIEIPENELCVFEAVASGIPVPSMTWIKDKTTLTESERIKMVAEATMPNQTTFKLLIENCKTEDAGQYIVKIKNALGEVTTQSKLNVLFGPKFVKELLSEYNVKEHDVTKLTAEINANPKAEVAWFKETSTEPETILSNDKFKLESQQNTVSLTIKDTLMTDAVTYVCSAKNKISETNVKAKVNVCIPPKFTQVPDLNRDIELGQSTSIKCIVRAFPLPEVKFIQTTDQKVIESVENGPFEIKSSPISDTEVEYILNINNIAGDACNSYECKATNIAGEASCKFNLNILRKPEFIKQPNEIYNLNESADFILECTVLAAPDATVAWFKDGNKLNATKRLLITETKSDPKVKAAKPEKSYSLKIVASNKEDAGVYEAVATNKLGEAKCSTKLVVEYPPLIVKDLKPKERGVEENSFTFECTIRGNPTPEIKWLFADNEISSEDSNLLASNEGDVYRLTVQKLSSSNAGLYKAVAKNTIGVAQTVACLLDVDSHPKLTAQFEGLNATAEYCELIEEENKTIELNFEIVGKPDPVAEYFKDDVKFKPTEKRVTLVKKENNVYKLTIPDIKNTDAGVYKVNAKNSVSEKSFTINLKVKSAPKLVKALKNKIECVESNKLELTTSIAPGVYPEPEHKWFRNDEEISEEQQKRFVILRDNITSTLVIENIDLSLDQSKFKYVAKNELGSCESETAVDVMSIPKFTTEITDCQPILNQPFEWSFVVDANPEPKLKLLKNDKELNLSRETRIKLNKDLEVKEDRKLHKFTLVFTSIVADDLGSYKIEASNKAGDAKCQAQLTVKGSACFVRKPVDTSVPINKPIKVEFEIAGIPTPDLVFLKNGQPFVDSDRIRLENKNKVIYWLNVKTSSKEDAGLYTVKISNDSGQAEESFNFSIQGKLNFCF